MQQFDITEPAGELVLTARRSTLVWQFVGVIAIVIIPVILMAVMISISHKSAVPAGFVIFLIVAFLLSLLIPLGRVIFIRSRRLQTGDIYRLDRARNMLIHNGRPMVALNAITGIKVYHMVTSGRGATEVFTIYLYSEHPDFVCPIVVGSKNEAWDTANKIGDYLGLKPTFDGTNGWNQDL